MKPTAEGDLLKMSVIIPTEEVDDTPLGMLYIRGTGVHFWKSPTYHIGGITRCTDVQSKPHTHKAHIYSV